MAAKLLSPHVIVTGDAALAGNAVCHGIEPHGRTGKLRVMARMRGDELTVSIDDSGVGFGGPGTGMRVEISLPLLAAGGGHDVGELPP